MAVSVVVVSWSSKTHVSVNFLRVTNGHSDKAFKVTAGCPASARTASGKGQF